MRRSQIWFTAALMIASTAFVVVAVQAAENDKKAPSAKFFSEPTIRTFEFQISDAALNQLRRSPRSYVTGTVREGDHVLTNVAIRIKGMGSFRNVDSKPSLAVKFDEFATNQHYRGLSKLMFNNSVQDPTYLAEMIATQMFRDAGVPAARVTHARVQLNGRDFGLYVVIEAMNKQFLKQHFTDASGNLYEAYLGDIDSRMEQDSGVPGNQSDVHKLYAACRVQDPTERWTQLNKVLDVDRFVSFVAMEMFTSHWDGYAIHTNNYRIYHDPKTDKFTFITHGIDWAFKRPNVSAMPPPLKSIVGRAVFSTPEGEKLYNERVRTLFTSVFKVPVITNRIEQALAKIRSGKFPPNYLASLERGATVFRERVRQRGLSVSNELAGIPPMSLKFDAGGVATLSQTNLWRDEPDRGDPLLDIVKFDGKETLHIRAQNESTRVSWRSQNYLKPGWYRFEGMARTESLRGGTVRLRISGDNRSVGVADTAGRWRPLTHVFEVRDKGMDVEFVCELNAMQGDAWFDVGSFRVRRITAQDAAMTSPFRRVIE
jgi:hypothetical protein